jgi:transposase-like protein
MDVINAAINAIKSREPGALFSYCAVAQQFSVDRTTLSRRHYGALNSVAAKAEEQQLLSLQQELELIVYIEKCTKRGLLPTREMVRNFASAIGK